MLYVTAFPPGHRSGGQFFSYNAIRDLSKDYVIDLIYFAYADHVNETGDFIHNEKAYVPASSNCIRRPDLYPLFTRRLSREVIGHLREIASGYDVLYFDYSQVAAYSLYVDHPCKVIRCHDIIAQKFARKKSPMLPWIRSSEKRILRSARQVYVPSEKDAALLESYYGLKAKAMHEYLSDFTMPETMEDEDDPGFLFFGLWSREENLEGLRWFLEQVWPKLSDAARSRVAVMGGGLSEEDRRQLLDPKEIRYMGFVKDSWGTIVRADAVLVPLFQGAGVKVKVLDAFTTGTPVIGTDVAFEGIPEIPGLMIRADDADAFAAAVNSMKTADLQQKTACRKAFLDAYDNTHLGDLLRQL